MPVFTARAGQGVRMRVLLAGGHGRNNVFQLHGHVWEEEAYTNGSTVIGSNALSQWTGSRYGIGAGGYFHVAGDYLYRSPQSFQFDGGLRGIFRVTQ